MGVKIVASLHCEDDMVHHTWTLMWAKEFEAEATPTLTQAQTSLHFASFVACGQDRVFCVPQVGHF